MYIRIRTYIYLFTILSASLYAWWVWWSYPARVVLDIYRDMGPIENFQILLLALLGFGACMLSRYRSQAPFAALHMEPFGQILGMISLLLIFRELDYFMTEFVEESVFLALWTTLIMMALAYTWVHRKVFFGGIKQILDTRAWRFFLSGTLIYLGIAQVVGTKDFRQLFYPEAVDSIRRFTEENIEVAGLFILVVGMLELHFQLWAKRDLYTPSFSAVPTEKAWQDWPTDFSAKEFLPPGTYEGESHLATAERTVTHTEAVSDRQALAWAQKVSYQLEALSRENKKIQQTSVSITAVGIVLGIFLIGVLVLHNHILREQAIEESTDRQLAIRAVLHDQEYERLVAYRRDVKRWWQKPLRAPQELNFRFDEVRRAIRSKVAEEYKAKKVFYWSRHRG